MTDYYEVFSKCAFDFHKKIAVNFLVPLFKINYDKMYNWHKQGKIHKSPGGHYLLGAFALEHVPCLREL